MIQRREFDFITSELTPGLSVIEASAGTGKTFSISHLVPKLLLDGSIRSLGQILLVTFTNDAARELSDRVRKVLENLHAPACADEENKDNGLFRLRKAFPPAHITRVIGKALLEIDRLGVSTIHSFCQRTLQSDGALCGLAVLPEVITDDEAVIESAVRDLWEERIAKDTFLSVLAGAHDWNISDDLDFFKRALVLQEPVFVPEVKGFDHSVAQVEELILKFTPKLCGEMRGLFARVPAWNESNTPAEESRYELITLLEQATSCADPRVIEAMKALGDSPSWVTARSKEGKSLKAELEGSEAVKTCRRVLSILESLRWEFQNECLVHVRGIVGSALHANRQVTYDGLIRNIFEALTGANRHLLANRLRERYRVALIDESQDTDPRQFQIFHRIFVGMEDELPLEKHRLVLIGDPKQAIYSFRGADVNTYLEARREAGEHVFQLTKTFRAPAPLVKASNAFFSRADSLLKEGLEFFPAESGLDLDVQLVIDGVPSTSRIDAWIVPDLQAGEYSNGDKRDKLIAAQVAGEITRLLEAKAVMVCSKDGKMIEEEMVVPRDIAVLVSGHREASLMVDALKERSVPAIRAGGDDIMASDEARELLVLLRAIEDPKPRKLRNAALATRLLGCNDRQIRELQSLDEAVLEDFVRWKVTLKRNGIAAVLAEIDQEKEVARRLAATENGERRITNLRQLTDLLQSAFMEHGSHTGQLLHWLAQEIGRAEVRRTTEERQLQLESDADAVRIITMHSAKGLEFPLVFCPFLWNSRGVSGITQLSTPNKPVRLVNVSLPIERDLEEELFRTQLEDRIRLAYVAITRAKVKVWIYGGACGGKQKIPSALDWLLRSEVQPDFSEWRSRAVDSPRGTLHSLGIEELQNQPGVASLIAQSEPPTVNRDIRWNHVEERSGEDLSALPAPAIPEPWGMTSFSSLTRENNPHGSIEEPSREVSEVQSLSSNPFFSAPGGVMVGTAVHDWIEGWNFSGINQADLETHFRGYPLAAANSEGSIPFHEQVGGMLEVLGKSILPGFDCSIAEACPHPGASEWRFQLPIESFGEGLSAHALAKVFAEHGEGEYAALLDELPAEQLKGYLHGFIDRVAFLNGAWGVIDWKTNKLGTGRSDYNQRALRACALKSHYMLQAHLYLVALRRYLGPEAVISGAWIVFLRAVESGTSEGILHVNPSQDLMSGLDALFAQSTSFLQR